LPQVRPLAWPLSVHRVVALGRFAYGAPLRKSTGADAAAIADAIRLCRLENLADRKTDTLSGGELARVHVARALAANAPVLLADEPTAALDPLHAFETLAILKDFCARGGAALVTLHDLSLAARFADRIALLHHGRVMAQGTPLEVLTPTNLAQAYGVRAVVDGAQVRIEGPA
jgi:iron complex transport system ATP-binding protein